MKTSLLMALFSEEVYYSFDNNLCKVRNILTSAPWDGPYYHCNYAVHIGTGKAGHWECYQSPADVAPYGWGSSSRFSVEPVNPEAQRDGDVNFRGNYNGLDYMLLHNLYFLVSGVPYSAYYIPSNSDGGVYPFYDSEINKWFGSTKRCELITSYDSPIVFNELYVASDVEGNTGCLRVEGGPLGVLLTNTLVEQDGFLSISFPPLTGFCKADVPYLFDPSAYQRKINTSNELPAYTMTDEFKQMTSNTISCNPNPIKDYAEINISLVKKTVVTVSVCNLLGESVNTIVSNENYSSGIYKLNTNLSALPAGMYYLTLQTIEEKVVSKIIKL